MKGYCKLDRETVDTMNAISGRLFTLKSGLELFLYCYEGEICSKQTSEIYSFGMMLQEYFLKTKQMYNEIEQELGILN